MTGTGVREGLAEGGRIMALEEEGIIVLTVEVATVVLIEVVVIIASKEEGEEETETIEEVGDLVGVEEDLLWKEAAEVTEESRSPEGEDKFRL